MILTMPRVVHFLPHFLHVVRDQLQEPGHCPAGMVVRGVQRGRWLELIEGQGFMLITSEAKKKQKKMQKRKGGKGLIKPLEDGLDWIIIYNNILEIHRYTERVFRLLKAIVWWKTTYHRKLRSQMNRLAWCFCFWLKKWRQLSSKLLGGVGKRFSALLAIQCPFFYAGRGSMTMTEEKTGLAIMKQDSGNTGERGLWETPHDCRCRLVT